MFGCFFFFCLFSFFLRRGLPLACSKVCLDASVDNVQSRAHELYGIIWLCSWSTFLFCRICLGRRCLHNLVGFYFHCFSALRAVQSPMTKFPSLAERQTKKGKRRKGHHSSKVSKSKMAFTHVCPVNSSWRVLIKTSQNLCDRRYGSCHFMSFICFPPVLSVKRMHGIIVF